MTEKEKQEVKQFACNPVGKLRTIINLLTDDPFIQIKLLSILSRELSSLEIEQMWREVVIENKQLKLML